MHMLLAMHEVVTLRDVKDDMAMVDWLAPQDRLNCCYSLRLI